MLLWMYGSPLEHPLIGWCGGTHGRTCTGFGGKCLQAVRVA